MPSKNAPSRKKSKGYYAKVKKGKGRGKKAGGGMTAKGVAKYRRDNPCLLYTSPSPRDGLLSRMPSSA